MAVFFWPCQDEVLDVQCKGLEVVVSRREGFICKQAQKALQCVQVSLPGAHTGLCQRVSRQAGGMGFQGAGAGAGGPAVSLRTPHMSVPSCQVETVTLLRCGWMLWRQTSQKGQGAQIPLPRVWVYGTDLLHSFL